MNTQTYNDAFQGIHLYLGLAIVLIIIILALYLILLLRKKIKKDAKVSNSLISELQENIKVALHAGGISLWKYNPQKQMFFTIEGGTLAGSGLSMEDNLNILHPDDRENQKRIIFQMLNGEISKANSLFRYKEADGNYRTYESAMSPIKNNEGEVISILGSQRDITDTYKSMYATNILASSLPLMKSYSWYVDLRDGVQCFNCNLKFERDVHQLQEISQFLNLIHKDDQQVLGRFREMLSQESASDVFLFRVDLEKIGEYEWWECYASIETKYDTQTPYKILCGLTINVNERELKTLELKELAKQSQLILHNSNSILVYLNTDYEVQWSNSKYAMNGIAKCHYITGEKCYQSFGYDAPCPNCQIEKVLKKKKLTSFEFNLQKPGNFLITAIPIISPENLVEGIVLRIDDVTQQTKLIEEIKSAKEYSDKLYLDFEKSSKLLSTILEEVPLGLFIKDINDQYRYMFASKHLCENIIQKPADKIIGLRDEDIFSSEAAEKFKNDDLKIIANDSEQVQYIGKEYLTAKGETMVVETVKKRLKLPDGVDLLIGYTIDITENQKINERLQEAKERAEQSDKLKSAFLANMSHEIRTPLNSIVGFSDLLVNSEDVEEKEEFGEIITNNGNLLLNLINDILDISKIEAGLFTFIDEIFDVNELCLELDSIFGMQVKRDVKLTYIPPNQVVNIQFDKNRYRQILNNFLSNAVKYTPTGKIEFGYEVVDGGVRAFVKDTGIGISPENQQKVFGRFAKFDDFAQGTGLGLAICKALTELKGGKIGFESVHDVGSTFWFWIPCSVEVTNIHERIKAIGTIKCEIQTEKYNILIAEDIDSNYMLINAILKEHNLTRAQDGQEAIHICRNNNFDLIFMDIKMPKMNGLEATRAIREFDKTTPIIALTANAFDSDKVTALEAGCNGFTSKPVSKKRIVNVLNQWLPTDI